LNSFGVTDLEEIFFFIISPLKTYLKIIFDKAAQLPYLNLHYIRELLCKSERFCLCGYLGEKFRRSYPIFAIISPLKRT
jgi:hypothetical protein